MHTNFKGNTTERVKIQAKHVDNQSIYIIKCKLHAVQTYSRQILTVNEYLKIQRMDCR